MNNAFRYYGKPLPSNLEKEALIIQDMYKLNDLQLSGLLNIHDFFKRVVLFDCSPYSLELVVYRYGSESGKKEEVSRNKLPVKTIKFFDDAYDKCVDGGKHFADDIGHKYFQRFAIKVLNDISHLTDYVNLGVIEQINTSAAKVIEFRS